MPISVPGLWKRVPGFLLDPTGPFVIRWRYLPQLLPWLARFIAAGRSWERIEKCAAARFQLCRDTVEDHLALAEEAGVTSLVRRSGLHFVYRDRSEYLQNSREWTMRIRFGLRVSEINQAELRQFEPTLSGDYTFGASIDDGAFLLDPGEYCAALERLFISRGGERVCGYARRLNTEQDRLKSVQVDQTTLDCDRAVIAAGAWSATLARQVGDKIPLVSERGYHVVVEMGDDMPRNTLMPSDGKMAVTPTSGGLRLAGQVELASVDAAPDWRRTDILLSFARKMFTSSAAQKAKVVDRWMGHRPSTPDGLPSIGTATGCPDVVHAFGHGHSGLCQAPATAKLVRALIDGTHPPFDSAPYMPQRFQ